MDKIYLDNAATTPLFPEVIDEMVNILQFNYGNPSSTHSFGQSARVLIEKVRREIAGYLKVLPAEIIFTSCGTESNNMILKSAVADLGVERIITSPLEHKCVAETILDLKKRKNIEIVYLRPNKKGEILMGDLEKALQDSDKKTLASLMHANNEIGNLIDLKQTALLCKEHHAYFHSDTVQTMVHMEMDFSDIPIDFASCSAHKFHGPKGIGFAFIRKSPGMKGIILGGHQERDMRAGTENICGIAGLGKAMELSMQRLDDYTEKITGIKKYTIDSLNREIPGIKYNGNSDNLQKSLYTVLSILLPFNDPMIGLELDMKGIAVSQGSACSSGAAQPSSVMLSILSDEEMSETTPIRISFSHLTTEKDIDTFVATLRQISDKFPH